MEEYEEFARRQINQIRKNEDEWAGKEVARWSSDISFYGVRVLSPLLNEEQREEMRKLREAASNVTRTTTRKSSSVSRVSYIQTVLDAVQLRKVPTLEEFKCEAGDSTLSTSSSQPITYTLQSKNECDGREESCWHSPAASTIPVAQQVPAEDVQIATIRPLTSTACDGHTALNLTHFKGEHSLENSHTTVLFEGVPLFTHGLERVVDVNPDRGFGSEFVPRSDKHLHVDVSQLGLSSGYVTNETSDINSSWLEGVGGTGTFRTGPEGRPSDFGGFFLNSSALTKKQSDIISHAPVDGDTLEEALTVSNQAQTDDDVIEEVNPPVEPDPAEGPYRMSLQNLLKKSQEHRRRQRLLRNQTRVLKAAEVGQVDKHSLSDKENEELLPGGSGKSEMRKTRDKKKEQGTDQSPELKMPCHDTYIQTQGGGREIIVQCVHVDVTDTPKFELSSERCLNITSASDPTDAVTGRTFSAPSSHPNMPNTPNRPTSLGTPTSTKYLYQSKGKKTSMLPRPCLAASKKFKNVPTPKFSLSPVRNKKGGAASGPVRKPLVKTAICVDEDVRISPCGQDKTKTVSPHEGTEDETSLGRSLDQSEQIAQLELKLSSLKVLISDLESTLAESQGEEPANVSGDYSGCQQTLARQSEGGPYSIDGKSPEMHTFSEAAHQEPSAEDSGIHTADKQGELPRFPTSLAQRMRVPEVFHTLGESRLLFQRTAILADTSNQTGERKIGFSEKRGFENMEYSPSGSSLNRSYDVDTPSVLWCQGGPPGKHLTPELGGQEAVSRAKRRLLMNAAEDVPRIKGDEGCPPSAIPNTALQRRVQELQLKQDPEVQVRTLLQDQRRQEEELLQSLAAKYQFLRSVSFPCPSVGSRLEDVATSIPPFSVSEGLGTSSRLPELTMAELSSLSSTLHISQACNSMPVCHRPLLVAAVKGYLTRRLLRTERVSQLVRTIKDTQLFLQGFQTQTPGRENISKQDRVLQERVALQLRSARYELHDLFFSLCPAERMQVIGWDRHLAMEKEMKRKENKPQGKGKTSLSAATRKALERKRTVILQKKPAERTKRAAGAELGRTFVPAPRRVPKKSTTLIKAR